MPSRILPGGWNTTKSALPRLNSEGPEEQEEFTMTNTENTALQMIAEAARCPDYGPDMVKALMKKLDMNEKGFALLMNVAPSTVRLWTSGAAQPCGTAKRLMQIYETGPEIVSKIAGGQPPADGRNL